MNKPLNPSTRPTFEARAIRRPRGAPVNTVHWCPWCEDVHWHGAAGGSGNRAPHCVEAAGSPLSETGYAIDIVGEADSERDLQPRGLGLGRTCREALAAASGLIRVAVLKALLDLKTARGTVLQKRGRGWSVWVIEPDQWVLERAGREPVRGRGTLALAALLYGVPVGVAGVRILEAATGDRLDAQAALAVQSALADWNARTMPRRPER